MLQAIKEQLAELEKSKKIKILLAVESGSRAWGFPSPDSDFDVRIIYVSTHDAYLSIENRKETIDYFHGELLDISGWDIRKTLGLLRKSNASPIEWAQSPIVYFEEEGFRSDLLNLGKRFFHPRHGMNHYIGIAKNSYHSNKQEGQIKLKKLFYVIRSLLAATWIAEKQTFPPMDIAALMPMFKEDELRTKINELMALKKTVNEDYLYTIEPMISRFITTQFELLNNVKLIDKTNIPDVEVLNIFFRKLVNNYP